MEDRHEVNTERQHIYRETNKHELRGPQKVFLVNEEMTRLIRALSKKWLIHCARDRWVIERLNHFLY